MGKGDKKIEKDLQSVSINNEKKVEILHKRHDSSSALASELKDLEVEDSSIKLIAAISEISSPALADIDEPSVLKVNTEALKEIVNLKSPDKAEIRSKLQDKELKKEVAKTENELYFIHNAAIDALTTEIKAMMVAPFLDIKKISDKKIATEHVIAMTPRILESFIEFTQFAEDKKYVDEVFLMARSVNNDTNLLDKLREEHREVKAMNQDLIASIERLRAERKEVEEEFALLYVGSDRILEKEKAVAFYEDLLAQAEKRDSEKEEEVEPSYLARSVFRQLLSFTPLLPKIIKHESEDSDKIIALKEENELLKAKLESLHIKPDAGEIKKVKDVVKDVKTEKEKAAKIDQITVKRSHKVTDKALSNFDSFY